MKTNKIRKSTGEVIFDIVVYVVALFCVYCLYPFAIILGSSFEMETNFALHGFPIIPKDFTTKAYQMVLGDSQIFKAYGVTIQLAGRPRVEREGGCGYVLPGLDVRHPGGP